MLHFPQRSTISAAMAASYCMDAFLLTGFALTGMARAWVPVVFVIVGLVECALAAWRMLEPLPRFVVACLIQLLFVALVPQLAFFFLLVLLMVFGFASLGVRPRHAVAVWVGVAVVLTGIAVRVPEVLVLPHVTGLQRGFMVTAALMTLARVMMLGLFSTHVRGRERRRTANVLHEDLAQDLTGISLNLSAYLSRRRSLCADDRADIDRVASQLRMAIQKTRMIAESLHPPLPPSSSEAVTARGVLSPVRSRVA